MTTFLDLWPIVSLGLYVQGSIAIYPPSPMCLPCLPAIREEISEIEEGKYDSENNVLQVTLYILSWSFLSSSLFYTILSDIASWTSRPTGCRIFLLPAECSPHQEHCHCIRMEPALLPRESRLPSSKFTPHRNCEKVSVCIGTCFLKVYMCMYFVYVVALIDLHPSDS